ncbi:hypothetical protein AB0O75_49835 [Streptomyces sp. NPDC088921]
MHGSLLRLLSRADAGAATLSVPAGQDSDLNLTGATLCSAGGGSGLSLR